MIWVCEDEYGRYEPFDIGEYYIVRSNVWNNTFALVEITGNAADDSKTNTDTYITCDVIWVTSGDGLVGKELDFDFYKDDKILKKVKSNYSYENFEAEFPECLI